MESIPIKGSLIDIVETSNSSVPLIYWLVSHCECTDVSTVRLVRYWTHFTVVLGLKLYVSSIDQTHINQALYYLQLHRVDVVPGVHLIERN